MPALAALAAACAGIPADPGVADSATPPAPQSVAASLPLEIPVPAAKAPAEAKAVTAAAPVSAAQAAPAKPDPAAEPPLRLRDAKDIDPPRAVDLSRPADDLWDRIRAGFAMEDLDTPLVGVRERWYASQPDYLRRMVERSK